MTAPVAASPRYMTAPAAALPVRYGGSQTYAVGPEHFDPDPMTEVTSTPATPRRVVASGPYGPGGQNVQISGTYTPPATVTSTTYDIGNHPVRSAPVAQVQQASRSYQPQYYHLAAPEGQVTLVA